MAPSRRSVKVGTLQIEAAYSVLNPMGFSKYDILKAIKSLLKVYGEDGWFFIEEYRYKVVIETILEARDTTDGKDEGESTEFSSADESLSYTPPRESASANGDEILSTQNNYNKNGKDKGKGVAVSSFNESPPSSPSANTNNATGKAVLDAGPSDPNDNKNGKDKGKAVAVSSFDDSPPSSPSVNSKNANGKAVLDAAPSNPNWLPREATETPYYMSPPAVGPSRLHVVSDKIASNFLWHMNASGNDQDAGLSNLDCPPPAATRTPFYDAPPAVGPSSGFAAAPVSSPPPNYGWLSDDDKEEVPVADSDGESIESCTSRSRPNPAKDLDG